MIDNDDPLALPLWINGHAYLTMTDGFFDVRNAQTGEVLRRTPLCGADVAAKAVAAAQGACAAWAAEPAPARAALLAAVADALAGYADHFARLIGDETGKDEALAAAEVAEAVALLRAASPAGGLAGCAGRVVAVVNDDRAPLAGLLSYVVPALAGGATVVAKPSPKAPSAAFAFAELTARAGVPAGVFNILQGDEAAIAGLCAQSDLGSLAFAGDAALGAKVHAIAERHGKAFVSRN